MIPYSLQCRTQRLLLKQHILWLFTGIKVISQGDYGGRHLTLRTLEARESNGVHLVLGVNQEAKSMQDPFMEWPEGWVASKMKKYALGANDYAESFHILPFHAQDSHVDCNIRKDLKN